MQIGYQLSSIKPYLDTEENIRSSFIRIASIGYRYVQLQSVPAGISDDVILSALSEAGLTCAATQEDYILGFGDDPDRFIRRAVTVGAKQLTMALVPFELSTARGLASFAADRLLPIVRKAEDAGLVFSFHPIRSDLRLIEGKTACDILMDALPESVHLTLCLSSCFETDVTPEDMFARYSGRIDLVHFKDYIKNGDGARVLTPLGQGLHDWRPYRELCEKNGVQYAFGEQETWTKDAFESAADTYRYLRFLGL